MKQLETKLTITYTWWNDDEGISNSIIDELDKRATVHADQMRLKGYTSGGLLQEINDVTYRGWWKINTERVEGTEQ